jgi:multicomponent Na+:H+ antiporter subunit B
MDLILLLILVVTAVAAVFMKDLLSATIVLGAYSLIMAVVWMRLNAVDVAFTEASVGAGITAVLIIAALSRTQRMEDDSLARKERPKNILKRIIPVLVVIAICGVLIYGSTDLPRFGDPDAPAHHHVADRYIKEGHHETASVNYVTAVLANYRGYDTLGETTVIFTAGVSVVLLLRRRKRKKR